MGIEGSRRLYEEAARLIVGGAQGHKRPHPTIPYPIFARRGEGCRFWDVDGNEYIDYLMGFGPVLLGYNYPPVDDAVAETARRGTIFDVESELTVEVARLLIDRIPCAEMLSFFTTGSGATMGAVRVARAYTGREVVVRCGYHGWLDWCAAPGPGIPAFEADLVKGMPYDDLEAAERIFKENPGRVACVILEAVCDRTPSDGYLEGLRELCTREGALLVFDEIKVGFRIAVGGAHEYYGIAPDLATFGKGLGNGYPVAVLVGRRQILEGMDRVWMAATFHGLTTGLAAARAVIAEIERHDVLAHIRRMGERLSAGLTQLSERYGIPARMTGLPAMPLWRWDDGARELRDKVYARILEGGVYLPTDHPWFISYSHTAADIDRTLEICEAALKRVL